MNNLFKFYTNLQNRQLDDNITFNILNTQIINHNINLSSFTIDNNFFKNNNNVFKNNIINKLINPSNGLVTFFINKFYRNYFREILKLYDNNFENYYFDKLIKEANQIIYFKSF